MVKKAIGLRLQTLHISPKYHAISETCDISYILQVLAEEGVG